MTSNRRFWTDYTIKNIQHQVQPENYGCTYYSFAALTGITDLLKFARDVSFERFQTRLLRKGFRLEAEYRNHYSPSPASFWPAFREAYLKSGGWIAALLSIDSARYENARHMIGVGFDLGPDLVVVSNPSMPDLWEGTFHEFGRTRFARAYGVFLLQPTQTSLYPPRWGDEEKLVERPEALSLSAKQEQDALFERALLAL